MTDPEGWQRRVGEAVSRLERPEERQRSLAERDGRAQAVTAAAADTSLGACLVSHSRAARSGVRGKPKRDRLPLSRRRPAVSTEEGHQFGPTAWEHPSTRGEGDSKSRFNSSHADVTRPGFQKTAV